MTVGLDEETNLDGLVKEASPRIEKEPTTTTTKIKNRGESMPKALSWGISGRDQGTKSM